MPTENLASYKSAHYSIPVGENPVQRGGRKMRAARGTSTHNREASSRQYRSKSNAQPDRCCHMQLKNCTGNCYSSFFFEKQRLKEDDPYTPGYVTLSEHLG